MGLYLFVNGLNRIALWQNARNPSDLFNAQFHSQLLYYHGLFTVFKFFYGLTDCSLTFLLPASRVYVSCLDMNIFTSITNILSPGSFFSTFLFLFRSFSQFFSSLRKNGQRSNQSVLTMHTSIVPHYYANVWRFASSSFRFLFICMHIQSHTQNMSIAEVMDASCIPCCHRAICLFGYVCVRM